MGKQTATAEDKTDVFVALGASSGAAGVENGKRTSAANRPVKIWGTNSPAVYN